MFNLILLVITINYIVYICIYIHVYTVCSYSVSKLRRIWHMRYIRKWGYHVFFEWSLLPGMRNAGLRGILVNNSYISSTISFLHLHEISPWVYVYVHVSKSLKRVFLSYLYVCMCMCMCMCICICICICMCICLWRMHDVSGSCRRRVAFQTLSTQPNTTITKSTSMSYICRKW